MARQPAIASSGSFHSNRWCRAMRHCTPGTRHSFRRWLDQMCGITGMVDLRDRREIDRNLLGRMNDLLVHRGPDGDGFHFEPGVGFGHRRLSIIDLEGGKQPLYNEDHSVVVTYNGEIYNFRE